jgi:CheY-like chemotaxis protein
MNLNMTIEEVLQLQQRSLPPRIHLETRLDPDLRMILADGTQMMQVLMNLGINAMEAIPQHGRIVFETRNCQLDESAELRAQGARSGPGVCVRVADTGSGMPPETLEKIFEPFFSTKFTGRGLGLAAVYGIIKNHDGFILVHSRMGEGSEFLLYFPAYGGLAAGTVLPAAEAPPAVAEPEKARATVLVIDDEMMVLEITAKLLGRLGYQALGAPGSQQALEIVRHHPGPIHAILLDLGMPGMGGAELFPLLRRERPSARILICSGYELESEAKPLIKQGAVGFVQKPYSLNDLGPALRKALESEPADVATATPPVAEESK